MPSPQRQAPTPSSSRLCPSCKDAGQVIGTSRGERVFQCPGCELCFLDDSVRCNAHLDNQWYEGFAQNPSWGATFLRAMEKAYSRQLAHLERLAPGKRILDLGAGVGVFLAVAKKKGWQTLGVEESVHASDAARNLYGLEYSRSLAELPDASLDVVRLSHVLEHVPEPLALLGEIERVLRTGGILMLVVPNREPLTAALVNRVRRFRSSIPKLAGAIYPHMHVLGFSPRSLRRLLEVTGFRTEEVFTISMGSPTYFPLFYDGLLNRLSPRQIPARQLIRYWLPMLLNNLGNAFGRGDWVVGYFRRS